MKRFLVLAACACFFLPVGCGDPEPTQTPEEVQQGHHQMHSAMHDAPKKYQGRRR